MISPFDPAHRFRFIVLHQVAVLLTIPRVMQLPEVTLLILLAPLALLHWTRGRARTTLLLSIGLGVVVGTLATSLLLYAWSKSVAQGRV